MDIDNFTRLLERDPTTSVLRYIDAFRDFAHGLDIDALICQELGRWLAQPRRPPPIVSENTVRIRNLGRFALDITVLNVTQVPRLISSHQDILQRFYGGGCYNIFEIVKEGDMPTGLRQGAHGLLSDGDVFGVDGSQQVFMVHSAKPIRFLSLSEFESLGIRYKFDSQSLRLVGTFAASPVSTGHSIGCEVPGVFRRCEVRTSASLLAR